MSLSARSSISLSAGSGLNPLNQVYVLNIVRIYVPPKNQNRVLIP